MKIADFLKEELYKWMDGRARRSYEQRTQEALPLLAWHARLVSIEKFLEAIGYFKFAGDLRQERKKHFLNASQLSVLEETYSKKLISLCSGMP